MKQLQLKAALFDRQDTCRAVTSHITWQLEDGRWQMADGRYQHSAGNAVFILFVEFSEKRGIKLFAIHVKLEPELVPPQMAQKP